jgi:phytoene dehydrogenase-like protein
MPYDAVVVGAGVNGLAAALHLAANGWKVIVVERADVAAVRSKRVKSPGQAFVTIFTP